MTRSIRVFMKNIIDHLSGPDIGFKHLAALFAATVIARNLLESITAGFLFPASAFLFHFPIAYVFPMLGLTALLNVFSGYDLRRLFKLMVFAWTLTLLPPILDAILGTSSSIGYFPLRKNNAWYFLTNFFNPAVDLPGTTAGIRIEAAIGCILAGIFTWVTAERRRITRGVLTTVVFAPVFLLFFTWPNLVYVIISDFFPHADTIQWFYQWHAATPPHFTGSGHYSIFLLDLVPVLMLLGWLQRKSDPDGFARMISRLKNRWWIVTAPLAGAAYSFSRAGTGCMTSADAISLTGAFMAGILPLAAVEVGGKTGWVLRAVSIAASAAVGWPTTAMTLLVISLTLLPGPSGMIRALSAAGSFLVVSSPAGTDWNPWAAVPILLCSAAAAYGGGWSLIPGLPAIVAAFLWAPEGTSSYTEQFAGIFDALSRNGRLDMALPVARETAASGGDLIALSKAELEWGNVDRAKLFYELGRNDSTDASDVYRLGLNLATATGNDTLFEDLFSKIMADESLSSSIDMLATMLLRAADRGDTLLVKKALQLAGPSPQLYHVFSMACASAGDMDRAASYAWAAVSHPDALPEQYAWAIRIAAGTGGAFDSLFTVGIERFPSSVPIMEARLTAPFIAKRPPDRQDLLKSCMALEPASPSVLRTAVMWYNAAGMYPEALAAAKRALAATNDPDPFLLGAACNAAAEAGDNRLLDAMVSYASRLNPETAFPHRSPAAEPGRSEIPGHPPTP